MEFDEMLIVPNTSLSLRDRAVEPWASGKFEYYYEELIRFCRRKKISTTRPFKSLTDSQRATILEGQGDFVGVIR